jgi:hypothetical protein
MTDQIDLEELIEAKKRSTTKKKFFRVGRLNTVQDVVAETAKLYRRTVHGHVDSNDAARQSSILANIRAGMEQGIMELRLTAIEDTIMRLAASRQQPILLNSHPLEAKDDEQQPKATTKN